MSLQDTHSQVISNYWINDEYKHLIVKVDKQASIVQPGQFFNLLCPQTEYDKPYFRRPMSTYFSDPIKQQVEFLYKVTGSGTRSLALLENGDTLSILGPLGKGFTLSNDYKHILIVGRGVGLATLAPLAEAAAAKQINVTVILSAKNRQSLMSQARFTRIGAKVIEVVDTDNSSDVSHVEQLILAEHHAEQFDCVFTCGSTRLTKLLKKLANNLAIDGQVALEQNMACGMGMCHCCIKSFELNNQSAEIVTKRVCVDGPVFDLKEFIE